MFTLLYRLGSAPILRRLVGDQRGQSLTEFALVAPLLFLLLFGIIDFGKAMNYWNDETQLAAMGARFAAVSGGNNAPGNCPDGSTPATLAAYIQCNADTGELRNGSTFVSKAAVTITFPTGNQGIGCPVQVRVSTNYNWLPILGLGSSPMVQTSTQRLEQAWSAGATGCP
jgi:Flp pilus assembly protein TadG